MESHESAGMQLENLHPAMSMGTRIAIVGAGPSGLAAALALTKLGYENVTVLESQPTVGGMCASAVVEGRVYDLGGQVLARESSPTLRTLMEEMDIEMEDMTEHRLSRIDCSSGKYEDMKVAADYISLMSSTVKLQAEAASSGKLGVHALSAFAHQPADEYLRTKGIAHRVPAAVAAGYTASGYGYPADMPYAYLHEFARTSMLGKIWRVKGGYSSFWQKVADSLPDVRCNVRVMGIERTDDKVHISISSHSQQTELEFDKLVMTGSIAYPPENPTYRSQKYRKIDQGKTLSRAGILDYTPEEVQLFSKVRTIEYYTTVLKITGLDLPIGFYYPKIYADDPHTMGHPVAIQRFFADTDVYLFWSYGNAQVCQKRVTELLLEDVKNMGGTITEFVLQRKWNYFPHVGCADMAEGFYDKMNDLQGKKNTFYLGALLAFELTERNVSYAFNLVSRCFGTTTERPYVKKLFPIPITRDPTPHERRYGIQELDELPGVEFPDLPSLDAYLSYYAKHKVVGERVLYTWLDDQGKEADKRTYADLDMKANIVARRLLTGKVPMKKGDRVLLLHPPGLEFIEAFFGCLRAGVLPVPLIPPDPTQRGGQALAKVENVAKASNAKAILTTFAYHTAVRAGSVRNMLSKSQKGIPNWPNLPWHHTDSWTNQKGPWNWLFSKNSSNGRSSSFREASDGEKQVPSSQNGQSTAPEFAAEKNVSLIVSPRSFLPTQDSDDVGSEEDEMRVQEFEFGLPSSPSDVCFLQFTSGSTGDSKGVMISHGGLIHNVKLMRSEYKSTSKTVLVSWLPQYHDMGLIGGLFTALVSGGRAVLFSPTTFIRKPMMWLDTMDKYKCTHSAGPNFAFELIVKRYEQLKAAGKAPSYDLSSLRFLMASAEPIRHKTIRAFVELLQGAGLREQVLAPGYGLAENCVFVCVAYGRGKPILVDWEGRVCCGYTQKGHKDVDLRIVDPSTFEERADGVEGEIWVSSPSMGVGYWGKKELGEQTFSNTLHNADAEDRERKFLRTGDLGRVLDGKLFVTGRIKDLIIVRGRNFYPADIEKVVENSSDALRPGCCAVFSAPHNILQEKGLGPGGDMADDGVVVVAELRDEKKIDADLPNLVKATVAEEYGIEVAHVSFIKPRTIAKTTSGKIRRIECLKRFTENQLHTVKVPVPPKRSLRRRDSAPAKLTSATSLSNASISPRPQLKLACKEEVTNFLVQIVAERTGIRADQISVQESLSNYSIDSVGIVWAAQKLSGFLGVHVAAIDIYTARCISELAETLDCLVHKTRSTTPPLPATPFPPAHASTPSTPGHSSRSFSKRAVEDYLVGLVAERTGTSSREISVSESLITYNVDSLGVVWAAQKLSDNLGVHIAAIDVYTAGCISELADNAIALAQKAKLIDGNSNHHNSNAIVEAQDSDLVVEGETLTDEELAYSLEPSLARLISITSLQAVGILYIATLLLLPAAFIYGYVAQIAFHLTPYSFILAVPLVPLAWVAYIVLVPLIICAFGARFLQPNFVFGVSIPLWSVRYVKWWTLYRLQEFASTNLAVHLRGTIFLTWWYRLLGAHIGNGVQLDTTDITDPGLLFVGNNVVIEEGATVQSHEVKGGIVYFRYVKINNDARVGAFSVLQRGTVVDAGASITALGKTEVGQCVRTTVPNMPPSKGQETSWVDIVRQLFGLYFVGLVSTTAGMIAFFSFLWCASKLEIFPEAQQYHNNFATGCVLFALATTFPWALAGVAPVLAFKHSSDFLHILVGILERRKISQLLFTLGVAYFCYGVVLSVFTITLKWCVIGRLDADKKTNFRSTSRQFNRIRFVHTLLRFTHVKFVSLLSGTEATCIYLRSLGARIGKLASIRGVNALVDPDLISLGPGSHLGDFAKILTSVRTDSSISVGKVTIGAGCMVGAHSVIMPGATLKDEAWLGAMSVAPAKTVLQSKGVYVGVDSPVRIYQRSVCEEKVLARRGVGGEKDYCNNCVEQMETPSINIADTTLPGSYILEFLRNAIPAYHKLVKMDDQHLATKTGDTMSGVHEVLRERAGAKKPHKLELAMIRLLQPLVQTTIPFILMSLSFYPSLLLLAHVGSNFGDHWMQALLPLAYLLSGISFAAVGILARRILVGQTKDGETSELWGMKTFCDTTWQSINVVLNETFLILGKGSLLINFYLKLMGSSVSSSAYIDTHFALNPDLLSIGAGSSIGHNAMLFGHLYEGGKVGFKSNLIGNYAYVGTRALVLPGLKMEDESQLGALGLGMKDEIILAY